MPAPAISTLAWASPQPTGLEDFQRLARRAMKESHTFFHPGDPQGDVELRKQNFFLFSFNKG